MYIEELVSKALQENCSDIHITVGTNVAFRKYGKLEILEPMLDPTESEEMIMSLMSTEQQTKAMAGNDLDFSVMAPNGSRMRVNIYHQRNHLAASIRLLRDAVPTMEELNLPQAVKDFAKLTRGLVLVTGPTGSGKTTTLSAILSHINNNEAKHIITVEDPIEYIYPHAKCMVHQREVGKDVDSFSTALRSALREDPDIIFVGEMRDYETISAAITAAETGHLVLATLHTTTAAQTIERIIDACPPHGQNQIRIQLASVIKGIVTQQLVTSETGDGVELATEVLVGTDAIANLIRENKCHQIPGTLQSGQNLGMHTMNSSLQELYMYRKISREDALNYSPNPKELERNLL